MSVNVSNAHPEAALHTHITSLILHAWLYIWTDTLLDYVL